VLYPYAHLSIQPAHASLPFLPARLPSQPLVLRSLYPRVASAKVPVRVYFAHRHFPLLFYNNLCLYASADGAVSAKIAEELTYENEGVSEGEPEFLKEFKNTGIWTVCRPLPSFFFFLCGVKVGY
jgi:hypothetical protein